MQVFFVENRERIRAWFSSSVAVFLDAAASIASWRNASMAIWRAVSPLPSVRWCGCLFHSLFIFVSADGFLAKAGISSSVAVFLVSSASLAISLAFLAI